MDERNSLRVEKRQLGSGCEATDDNYQEEHRFCAVRLPGFHGFHSNPAFLFY